MVFSGSERAKCANPSPRRPPTALRAETSFYSKSQFAWQVPERKGGKEGGATGLPLLGVLLFPAASAAGVKTLL